MIVLRPPLDRPLQLTPHGAYGEPRPARNGTHYGVDLVADNGDLVRSASSGVVARVGFDQVVSRGGGGGGQFVIVKSGAYELGYMHLAAGRVSVGDVLAAGDPLGYAGNSGAESSGPHLHFQITQLDAGGNKLPIDPTPYLAIARPSSSASSPLLSLLGVVAIGLAIDVALDTPRGRAIKRYVR